MAGGFQKIKEFFSFGSGDMRDTSIDSSGETTNNPVVDKVLDLIFRPRRKRGADKSWIAMGPSDNLDRIIDSLAKKSSTHEGVLTKKAKMVAGNEIEFKGQDKQRGMIKHDFSALLKMAGGSNNSFYSVFKKSCLHYEKYGAAGVIVTFSPDHKRIVKLKPVGYRNFRIAEIDSDGDPISFIYKQNFKYNSIAHEIYDNEERKIPIFSPKNTKDDKQFLYISNPISDTGAYSLPNYLAAYHFIAADYEFGRTIHNAAGNGFSPKILATFIGRNLSNEEKEEEAGNFKSSFQGSGGEQVMTAWVRKAEDAPNIQTIETQNLDKTIQVMSVLNDSKILTAHSVTSPALFGVMIAGKLGGSGTELLSAYNLFRVTETLPTRSVITSAYQSVLDVTAYDVELEIIDEDVVDAGDRTVTSEYDTNKKSE